MRILAIDPGNEQSAYVLMSDDYKPLQFGKVDNAALLASVESLTADAVVIEMVASYGMAVGEEVFETVFWIGRLFESARLTGHVPHRMKRMEVKMNLCHAANAKDGNIETALQDRFGKRKSKKNPNEWFPPVGSGWADDVWQAYALGVTFLDQHNTR